MSSGDICSSSRLALPSLSALSDRLGVRLREMRGHSSLELSSIPFYNY